MKAEKIHQQQMLERVFNFGQANLGLFPEGSAAGEAIAAIGAAVAKLKDHASQQVSGHGDIQKSGISRAEARKALKYGLDMIGQTARVLELDQFYMPRPKTDGAYIAAAQAFAQQAKPFEKSFIKQGLRPDFIQTLIATAADLQQSSLAQNSSKGVHSSSIADFNKTLAQALIHLKRFDTLVKNTLSDNAGIMAAWKIARHVGRPAGKGVTAPAPAPTEVAVAKAV